MAATHIPAILDDSIPACRGEITEGDTLSRHDEITCPDCLDVLGGKWIRSIKRTVR